MGTDLLLNPGLDPGTECYCLDDGPVLTVPGDRHDTDCCPERALFMAVLDSALRDACRGSGLIRATALDWLRSRTMAPPSFRWICDILDLNPDYVLAHRSDWRVAHGGHPRSRRNARVMGPMVA